MNRYDVLPAPLSLFLLALVLLMILVVGWHQELAVRYPLSDLPTVNSVILQEQIRQGKVSRWEARYYRMMHAGSDTAEIR